MDDQLPGFRFYPTEEELVSFYLYNMLNGTRTDLDRVIPVVDIYDYNPWHLPQLGGELCPAESEQWFFFSRRQEREARGGRPNRLTTEGYWKATGSPGDVYSSQNSVIGRKRTMVFYVGRAPNGTKTTWKMNEYKLAIDFDEAFSSSPIPNSQLREELSLCRIYRKSRSMRAFDRRPPFEAAATGGQAAALHHHDDNDAAILDHPILAVPETTDSSSTPGYGATNPGIASSSEPSWDSDQFNWFDLSNIM